MNTAQLCSLPERTACDVLDIDRQTVRNCRQRQAFVGPPKPCRCVAQKQQPRALKYQERQQVLDILNSDQYADQPPAQVYYDLLSRGEYLCSISTMQRVPKGVLSLFEKISNSIYVLSSFSATNLVVRISNDLVRVCLAKDYDSIAKH